MGIDEGDKELSSANLYTRFFLTDNYVVGCFVMAASNEILVREPGTHAAVQTLLFYRTCL